MLITKNVTVVYVDGFSDFHSTTATLHFTRFSDVLFSFIPVKESELAPYLKPIRTEILKTTLTRGIGFFHKRMTAGEKSSVSKLFRAGAVQVCSELGLFRCVLSWGGSGVF